MLPVEAQAAFVAPTSRAWLNAADMPLSLKLPDGFIPSYCRVQPAGRHADVAGHAFRGVQQRLPFADRDALPQRRERQQFVKSPHAAKTVRIVAMRPFLLERGQRPGTRQPVPVVRTSNRLPQRSQATRISSMAYVARQAGEIHRWQAGVVAGIVVLSERDRECHCHNLGNRGGPIKGNIASRRGVAAGR